MVHSSLRRRDFKRIGGRETLFVTRDFEIAAFGPANLFNISDQVKDVVGKSNVRNGFVALLSIGSTGALTRLTEDAHEDFVEWVRTNLPFDSSHRHPGNAFAHLRSSLIGCDLILPLRNGEILGDSQSIVLLENTAGRKRRRISLVIVGEA